jgi:chemotaxis protein CheX
MDPTFIKPFIASIQNVFSTMMQLQVTVKEPFVKRDDNPSNDVSGIIGMSGDVQGVVVLSFPQKTAENIVALFAGQQMKLGTPDFADAVGELVNMVSGGAKAMFKDKKVSISCPSVIVGSNHHIARQSDIPCIVIPCGTDCGDLFIEVAIKPATAATANKVATATAAKQPANA